MENLPKLDLYTSYGDALDIKIEQTHWKVVFYNVDVSLWRTVG